MNTAQKNQFKELYNLIDGDLDIFQKKYNIDDVKVILLDANKSYLFSVSYDIKSDTYAFIFRMYKNSKYFILDNVHLAHYKGTSSIFFEYREVLNKLIEISNGEDIQVKEGY